MIMGNEKSSSFVNNNNNSDNNSNNNNNNNMKTAKNKHKMMLIKGIKIDGCPLLENHDSLFVTLVK